MSSSIGNQASGGLRPNPAFDTKASKSAYTGVLNVLLDVTFRTVMLDQLGATREHSNPSPVRKYKAKAGKLVIENGLIMRVIVDPTPIDLS